MPDALTLEQELEALVQSADYRVTVYASDNYLKLRVIYVPKLVVNKTYIANGVIAEQHWICKSSRRRWRKARKWVLAEIAGHREMLQTVGQA